MVITLSELRDLGACDGAIQELMAAFGESIEVTRENLLRMSKYSSWLVEHHPMLASHKDAFKSSALGAAGAAYEAATHPHWRAWEASGYETDMYDAYLRARTAANDEYNKALANALADLIGLPGDGQGCAHEPVNIGFNTIRMACRHCGEELR